MSFSYQTAVSTQKFVNSLGVNTHIDFVNSPYANLAVVENSINYLGIHNLRDSPDMPADLGASGTWQKVANATGAKFDAFLREGSIAHMQGDLTSAATLASQGILNFIEGGNEEDDQLALQAGNSLAAAASYQKQVFATGHEYGLQVINMSFGQGWSTSSTGDYGKVGSLAAYADYANAHTYAGTGNPPNSTIATLNADAQLAAVGRPVITTEFGYYTSGSTDASSVSQTAQAKYILDGVMDAFVQGDAKTYLYELLDEHSGNGAAWGNFGLFTSSGAAKPAATALHNLTTLLADSGSAFTAGTLSYSLSGTLSTDHSMLLEKSDGTFWLAIWNEARLSGPSSAATITVPNHTVTLGLASTAGTVRIFDPMNGTSAQQTLSDVGTLSVSVPDHPILVEIVPGTGTGTGADRGTGTGTGTGTATQQDLSVAMPAAPSLAHGASAALTGISIHDAWAATRPGSMALDLSAASGTLEISEGGSTLTGHSLHLTGTLSQLNADLASLHYQATNLVGVDTVTVSAWNQAGVSSTHALAVHVT
jgi:hypothetical protein